jgi:hypothetical protein
MRRFLAVALWVVVMTCQAAAVPDEFTRACLTGQLRVTFSEQSGCSLEKCVSPTHKDFAVISRQSHRVVVHGADGSVRSLKLPYDDEIRQENWSRDGRFLIILSIFNGPHRSLGDVSYYDISDRSFRSVDAAGHLAAAITGYELDPIRANSIVVCTYIDPPLSVFDLVTRNLRPFN